MQAIASEGKHKNIQKKKKTISQDTISQDRQAIQDQRQTSLNPITPFFRGVTETHAIGSRHKSKPP
jgi:hypothetical protein